MAMQLLTSLITLRYGRRHQSNRRQLQTQMLLTLTLSLKTVGRRPGKKRKASGLSCRAVRHGWSNMSPQRAAKDPEAVLEAPDVVMIAAVKTGDVTAVEVKAVGVGETVEVMEAATDAAAKAVMVAAESTLVQTMMPRLLTTPAPLTRPAPGLASA